MGSFLCRHLMKLYAVMRLVFGELLAKDAIFSFVAPPLKWVWAEGLSF